MITKIDRETFVNNILLKLELCNYGFQLDDNNFIMNGYSMIEAKNMRAIKELKIRMNLWIATNREDIGRIEYPEANRVIEYKFDDKNIGKCRVDLLKKR